ncbi:hypothetical protein V6Z11_D03G193400 [Gossypium hirsutum]
MQSLSINFSRLGSPEKVGVLRRLCEWLRLRIFKLGRHCTKRKPFIYILLFHTHTKRRKISIYHTSVSFQTCLSLLLRMSRTTSSLISKSTGKDCIQNPCQRNHLNLLGKSLKSPLSLT